MLQHVFIVSDGTGRTAQQALKAALVQFEFVKVQTHIWAKVRSEQQVLEFIYEAYKIKALVIHTIVSEKLRHLVLEQGRLHDLVTIDLMGPLLAQLSQKFETSPTAKPGLFHTLNKAYFQRIEAIEFTLRHDDGQRVEELNNADIILLGVSRTFKTPISVYMAHKGWSVANIPIILGFPIPDILYKLPHKSVFCLTTYPSNLIALRTMRDKHLGGLTGNYSDRTHVKKELNYALRIFKANPKWTIVNVTQKPIEEISSEILSNLRKK
ncbi:MAG: kinase/pyrophosphorylase [Flavobacteriaceae bacterium]|nr:kinase/pyrophosphorylase [Flavobacteriaceae bacterium]